ncbi:two-component regulator propeller domain-containing protein [Bacteroides sp. 519]|uniref:hybrid sensor histidine kinase/response regulator transcription factor n=1 Tax=Bacteroides sp. 519 TaxID=2302937 RepID=UPI0013D10B4E|nr:two-component regulator propeller domain-containing protein [Bacteroides sp. 519]NDV58610.1 response regulator [Bacteroides sp. 519]
MTKHTLITLVFTLLCINTFAGSFKQLGVKDGLSSRQVFRINKDSNGFIWFFTSSGVDRYDGNEIRHYQLDEESDSQNHILSSTIMTCDKSGNIWISLKNGKIYAYNKSKDRFVLKADLANTSHPSPVILNDILFDSNNQLLVCTYTGIHSLDIETNTLLPVALHYEYVNRVIQADENTFYAGTNTHVYQLTKQDAGNTYTAKQLNLPMEVRAESLYISGNKLYVGSFSNGVFVVELSTGKTTSLHQYIPSVPIRAFAENNGAILVATDGSGVYKIDKVTNQLIDHYIADEDDDRSLSGNTASDIYVDERNGIWVSTYTHGVSYLAPENPDIEWVRHGHNNQNSLISSHINTAIQDSEGDYWYGTNNGISLYQPKSKKWTHFLNDKSNDINYSSVVLALCEDKNGNVWTGGYGIGVYCINKKKHSVQKIKSQNNNEGIASDYIYTIYSEGDNIWFGGIEGELTCYNTSTGKYTYYPIDCLGDIKSGTNNNLLIAGCGGLGIFNKSTGNTAWHNTFNNTTLRYPIRCLILASSGDIWLATNGEGLIQFNPTTNKSRIYTINDGFNSNAINSLIEDNAGRIWFTTERELYCLDLKKDKVMSMNEFLDIHWGYYNPNAAMKLQNGNLAFGTAEGLLAFYPHFDFEKEESADLIFTDFKLLYQSVKAGIEGSLLQQAINETSAVKLKYAQNSFSISFSAINFVHPHKVRYEYKLENFNDEWEHSNNTESVNYMNLSPGKYIFKLKAIDKYTHHEIGERSLEIVIGRPFWGSWWAILIYLIVISALIFLIIQFARNKINEYNTQEKIRSFINIAHDIRTPITLIKAPLSELESQPELPEKSRKDIAVASRNAERLFTMVTQLLDLQKTEMHPEKLSVAEQDINLYMEEKISDFRLAAIQKGLDLYLDIAPNFPKVWFDRNKMNNIMDNLLSNALKYTEEGSITIIVNYSRYKWGIEVKDTGIGIPQKEQSNLFHQFYRAGNAINSDESGSGIGLVITRRMIRQQHGKITFNSVENQGTTFTVTFPRKLKVPVVAEIPKKPENTVIIPPQEKLLKPSTRKNVLLLAEDDDDMREYLTDSLSSEYEVVSVTDGGKALETAREINPDIIISDVIMPILQGDELCRMLKSSVETSHIPVILLTALNERENIIFGLEAGANDYIIKPFDFSVLKVRIRNILQNRQHLRETVLSSETNLTDIDYTSQLDKEFLDKAMEIINTEMANPEFSINDFCQTLGMSRTSVYNKIKTLTDQSPNDFIRIIRLNKSKELLLSRKYTIGEVSSMVGFSDPKYFSTCFKKQFSISPSKI